MADENLIPEPQVQEPQTPQISQVEQRAMEQGWVPQDQWAGEPDDWRPAKEFVDRGELLKSISALKRDNLNMKQAMHDFGRHHAATREIEYKRAMNDLKLQKREALVEGDADKVIAIDDTIDELKEAKTRADNAPQQQTAAEPHPAFLAWEQRNNWYKSERAMKNVADEIARELVQTGERDPVKILQEVDRQIRKEFPNKFVNPNREKAGSVEGSTNKGGRADPTDRIVDSMSDDERRIMKRIISTGVITKEKYLEEYKAHKGA